MDYKIRINTLRKFGFYLLKETSKAYTFKLKSDYMYLLPSGKISLVLDPKIVETNNQLEKLSDGMYHSSALKFFPIRMHGGKNPIHYGYIFKFDTIEKMSNFLEFLVK